MWMGAVEYMSLKNLGTEQRNEQTPMLDRLSSGEVVRLMNNEDKTVAYAVEQELESITKAVDCIVQAMENGGRLFYYGAGTSGRLGILDASECPPTFGTSHDLVQGVIAGGEQAIVKAIEGAEDNEELGARDVIRSQVCSEDVVVGIAASGRTPYVIGALIEAKKRGASTISLSCNAAAEINRNADISINVVVGPEILTGSTRLKAGTAQKMVLNMLTTASMIRLGKVYKNYMVNVKASNYKLRERVKGIVMQITHVNYEEAERLVEKSGGDVKVAIIMKLKGLTAEKALEELKKAKGKIRSVIEN
jgi:N-acetylmuramic acid 6-phosphate etherase